MSRWQITLVGLTLSLLTPNPVSPQQPVSPAKLKNSPTLVVRIAGSWKSIHKGTEYRKLTLERSEPKSIIELKLMRFDTQWVIPRVVRSGQYQLKSADVKTLAEKSGAIATVNANYFDEKGRALGFLKVGGQEINRTVSKSSLFTGIFGVRNHSPFVVHRDEFQPAEADEALQSGPLLLNRGMALEVVRGLGRYSRRAVIGIDKEQRIIIGVTETILGGLSWEELQELFAGAQWQLQTLDLLNLDGGGSAQLYIKTTNLEELIPGTSEVPVAIGFFNKAH